jgi:hypothetical protein
MKLKSLFIATSFAVLSPTGFTQAPAPATATTAAPAPAAKASKATAEKKLVYALIAAVGDQFTYVRQRESTGSNIIDNNNRRVVKVENNLLNMSVLRGMDAAIAKAHPDSERVFITLNAAEMEGVLPHKREEVALGKIISTIEKMPERMNWEKILVATPKYLQSEYSGMGPKLQGIGVYVQPLESARLEGVDIGDGVKLDIGAAEYDTEKGTVNPNDGKANKQPYKTYVAPFNFIRMYVIDPKTLTVLEKNARHDFQKFHDPTATALDVGKSIPLDVLAPRITALIERSAARAIGETEVGTVVTIEEVKPGTPVPAKK